MKITMPLGKADAIGGLAGSNDDLADAELHRRLDDIVGAHRVDPEGLVVWLDQDARHGGEMHHGVEGLRPLPALQVREIAVHRQRIEDLAAIRDVGDQIGHAGLSSGTRSMLWTS